MVETPPTPTAPPAAMPSYGTRRRVADEAATWLHTPYHHHGRVRGVGVDCAQLLAAVYEAAGLVPTLDLGNYPAQWHLHRGEEVFISWLQRCGARQLQASAQPQAGDVGVWRYGRAYSHGGVVVEGGADPLIVHAYIGRGVINTRASEEPLAGRACQYWGVI